MTPSPSDADPSDDGIAGADRSGGAPPPAPGFGIGDADPDVLPPEHPAPDLTQRADRPGNTP